ncbi:MAG: hypothetical protein ACLSAF_21260 [Intestinimonas sp.]
MDWNQVPTPVRVCCAALWEAGYEACPVGGCIRDTLLGRPPGDWDVASSALPETVVSLFPRTVPTGLRHGTVTVLLGDMSLEVTAFRREGDYADGRHPDAVSFGVGLREDLARRDFTVNAMALRRDGTLADPFGGQADLDAGLIRCVGNPDRRFQDGRAAPAAGRALRRPVGLHPGEQYRRRPAPETPVVWTLYPVSASRRS